jgi:hypothetical protein
MNRLKKEQAKNPKSSEALKQERFVKFLEHLLFPEETDWMYDDAWAKDERKKGNNPMSEEYTERVNQKRKLLGVSPLGSNGLAADNASGILCQELSKVIDADSFGNYLQHFAELVLEEEDE